MNLEHIIKLAWIEWKRATEVQLNVPKQSAPVLWFGNLDKYMASEKKIVTVAVNPGPKTFPTSNPWKRYPLLNPKTYFLQRETAAHYTRALNQYTFDNWFTSFLPLFECFNAAYDAADNQSQVLHLDISPIMTNPIWSECDSEKEQVPLRIGGLPILYAMLEYLQPDCIFLSISGTHYNAIRYFLGIKEHVHRDFGNAQVMCGSWKNSTVCWIRKMHQNPVSGTRLDRKAIGRWVIEGCCSGGEVKKHSADSEKAYPKKRKVMVDPTQPRSLRELIIEVTLELGYQESDLSFNTDQSGHVGVRFLQRKTPKLCTFPAGGQEIQFPRKKVSDEYSQNIKNHFDVFPHPNWDQMCVKGITHEKLHKHKIMLKNFIKEEIFSIHPKYKAER